MNINRKNYEAYFLDYRENNLSTEQVAELMIFLEDNPDLKVEFDSFESFTLQAEENITFSKKEALKKTTVSSFGEVLQTTDNIDSDNYEEKLIASLEGDISEEESMELAVFMELNPKVKLESNLYRSTTLEPELSISYPNKESLKKKGVFVLYRTQMIYGLSIAASIIILLGFYFGFLNQPADQFENNQLTNLNKIEIIQPDILDTEISLTEIQQKNNFSAKSVSNQTIAETNIIKREDLGIAGMETQSIQAIYLNDNDQIFELYIEARQTQTNNYEIASNTDPIIIEEQKPKKSLFRRFIAGMTNKLIDVDRPEKKSFFEYTIDGYNFMADKEVAVDKELDENGNVVAYRVNGENISLGRSNRNGTTE